MCGRTGEFNRTTFSEPPFSELARRVEYGVRNSANMRMDPPEIVVKIEGCGFYRIGAALSQAINMPSGGSEFHAAQEPFLRVVCELHRHRRT
jgi:hypothetical protein